MVRASALICIAAICFSAQAAPRKNTPSPLFSAAKRAVTDRMRDPTSVLFKELEAHRTPDGAKVCGLVNGKNAYGGYSGFERFVWIQQSGEVQLSSDADPTWLPSTKECWHY